MICTTEGKITLEVNKLYKQVKLVTKDNHKTIDEITLEDTYYNDDAVSLLKELMGQCMNHLITLSSEAEMLDMVEDELDNWGSYEVTESERG